ncbi:hypothetical protein V6N12_009385 [Hibiscus sabdariffa]|uniref:Uncharacterized protein n=1 Tax=Hibiscus sabdariffa TaxID=183260 RepID=A0ABR2E916_9ROSI
MLLMLGCPWDYSDPIAGLIEFPFLPRPRISADVFSAPFWVFSFGAALVQLLSLRFCYLCVPPRSENDAPPSFLGWMMVCLLVLAGLVSSVQHAAGCGLALSPVLGLQCGLGRDGGCV